MSSLVDSTYRALALRLQRGGTNTRPVSKPDAHAYKWGFEVFAPGDERGTKVLVTVGILTKNVYKNDKVSIKVSEIHDIVPVREFTSPTGNCPPLDSVEAFIRKALAEKQALPAKSSSKKESDAPTPPPPAPPVVEVQVEEPACHPEIHPPPAFHFSEARAVPGARASAEPSFRWNAEQPAQRHQIPARLQRLMRSWHAKSAYFRFA